MGLGAFGQAFFFSVHTLTTVGYGDLYPLGLASNVVAAVEAAMGLMGFALATGLLFARFSRPNAQLIFSDRMVVSPYGDGHSLQFRDRQSPYQRPHRRAGRHDADDRASRMPTGNSAGISWS